MFTANNILSTIEPILLGVALWALVRSNASSKFPAFCTYLSCRLLDYAALTLLLHAVRLNAGDKHFLYAVYYYVYWAGYLAGALLAFLAIQEVFRILLKPFPGLSRFGLIGFRWVTLISVIISLATTIFPVGVHRQVLITATSGVMRCISILELCLLAFILLSMQTLQLSWRSRSFGLSAGLAMIASAELFGSAFAFGHPTMASAANYASQVVVTLASAVWAASFLKKEASSAAAVLPLTSSLSLWNEIASALAQPVTPVMMASSTDFFLQDVEKAVDRVLKKNSMNPVG